MTSLEGLIAEQRGFFFRWQVKDLNYSDSEIEDHLRGKDWVKLRRGTYALAAQVDGLAAHERHVLVARSVVARLTSPVVLTHYSALALQGVPLWGVDLGEVHVHRGPDGTSRRHAGIFHHTGPLPDEDLMEVDGILVTRPEQTVLDVARCLPFEAAVVLADGGRRLLPFDMEVAERLQEEQRDYVGAPRAGRVLRFSDPRAESVGESRTRVMMARIAVPAPTLQRPIVDESGEVVARTDLYVEEFATAVEFDGKKKYGRALYERAGVSDVDLHEVIWKEKRREDDVRDLGHQVVRIVWFELDGHDRQMRQRFDRAFERSGRLAG